MNNKRFAATLLAALFCFAFQARAVDGISAEAGRGAGADVWRLGAHWNWDKRWFDSGRWHLGAYWEFQLGQWRGEGKNTITDIALTPVFRYQRSDLSRVAPYVEAAIGFHLISNTRLDADRRFGSAFQFGDHVGAGVRFGDKGRYDLGIRLQHLSNGGIKKPNAGINFALVRFAYNFD
jgi:lipid A 3-O-deacylase